MLFHVQNSTKPEHFQTQNQVHSACSTNYKINNLEILLKYFIFYICILKLLTDLPRVSHKKFQVVIYMYIAHMQLIIKTADRSTQGKPQKVSKPRKRKVKKEKQEMITDHMPVKKKRDRFHGMPEDEVAKRLLPDHLAEDLDIVIVSITSIIVT